MKIIPQKLKALFAGKHKAKDKLTNPERDWHKVLILFTSSLLLSAALHYILYLKLDVAPANIVTPVLTNRFLRTNDLAKVVAEYRAREAVLNELLANLPATVDPVVKQ